MNYRISNSKVIIAALAALAATYITASLADESRLVPPQVANEAVAVEIDTTDGAVISGRLVNRTGKLIKDPRITISYNWLWVDEFKPGRDSLGWVEFHVVPGELQPDQGADFSFDPGRPLPERADGYIVPSAAVTEFTIYD